MKIGLSAAKSLVGIALAFLQTACFYPPSASSPRHPDDPNVAGRKTLEETYPKYCNADTVKPDIAARFRGPNAPTNESCQRMRGQLEAYKSAPNGVPLPRPSVDVGQATLRDQYSRMCIGDHMRPDVAASYARSRMAKYAPSDGTCKTMQGLLLGDPVESTEGYIADMKKRAGFSDTDMPIEHAQIELLKSDPRRARPYILSMEGEAMGNFGLPGEMQLLGTSNLLGAQYGSPGMLAPSLAVLFDLSIGQSTPDIRANALQLMLAVQNKDLTRAVDQIRSLQALARRADSVALVKRLQTAYARTASVWAQAALRQTAPTSSQLDPLIYEIRDLEQQLNGRLPAAGATTLAPRAAEVRAKLGPHDALIEFMTVWLPTYQPNKRPTFELRFYPRDIHYVAYVLTGAGQTNAFDLGEADTIDALLKNYRCEVQYPPPDASDNFSAVTQPLYRALWLPLTETLAPIRNTNGHTYIAADGALSSLPFDALIDEQGRFLIENWQISYLASGADLARLPAKSAPKDIGTGADIAVFVRPRPLGIKGPEWVQHDCGGGDSGLPAHYQSLEGTHKEGEAIQHQFSDARVFGARGKSAGAPSESNLKHMASPRVLHLATHGYYIEAQPAPATPEVATLRRRAPYSLLRSGVILEEFGSRGGAEDGIATGLELAMLDLHATDLVVLSACDTGLRDGMSGDSVGGLRSALRIAGAKTIVSSLWPVSDADTGAPELMEEFYTSLAKGMTVDGALRAAKRATLRRNGFRHPHYWASFVLDGRIDVCLRSQCANP